MVGLKLVWAETMAVNQVSRAVMTKLGMRHVRTVHRVWDDPLPGAEHGEVVYQISRDEWVAPRPTEITLSNGQAATEFRSRASVGTRAERLRRPSG